MMIKQRGTNTGTRDDISILSAEGKGREEPVTEDVVLISLVIQVVRQFLSSYSPEAPPSVLEIRREAIGN